MLREIIEMAGISEERVFHSCMKSWDEKADVAMGAAFVYYKRPYDHV